MEDWAEIRRLHRAEGLSIKTIAKRLKQADWVFSAEARSIAQARVLVAQRLVDLTEQSLDVVLLLTSELITNAVQPPARCAFI